MRIPNKRKREVLTDFPAGNRLSRYPFDPVAQGPCKTDMASFKSVKPANRTSIAETRSDVHQSTPKSPISRPLRVSDEQCKRIVHRYNEQGHSIRRISREEKRARQTVTRIVRTAPETLEAEKELEKMQEEIRREFQGMAHKAFKSLERAMKKDWRVAARYLELIGVAKKTKWR